MKQESFFVPMYRQAWAANVDVEAASLLKEPSTLVAVQLVPFKRLKDMIH